MAWKYKKNDPQYIDHTALRDLWLALQVFRVKVERPSTA
jgi:hypothetical protein